MSYRKLVSGDNSLITYRPKLNEITGSVLGTILFQQILYWWDKNGERPFYKFAAPAEGNRAYKEGDSWQEELGFTRSEFQTARKVIAKKRKKGEPSGDELVTYRVDINRMTWYTVNEQAVENALSKLYVVQDCDIMNGSNHALDYTETTTETTTESKAPPPETPQHFRNMQALESQNEHPEPIQAIISALADITLKPKTNAKLVEAAYELFGQDATPEELRALFSGSGCWWFTGGAGSYRDNNNMPPNVGNITGELLRARAWAQTPAAAASSAASDAERYHAEFIAPLAAMNGHGREHLMTAPEIVRKAVHMAIGKREVTSAKYVTPELLAANMRMVAMQQAS